MEIEKTQELTHVAELDDAAELRALLRVAQSQRDYMEQQWLQVVEVAKVARSEFDTVSTILAEWQFVMIDRTIDEGPATYWKSKYEKARPFIQRIIDAEQAKNEAAKLTSSFAWNFSPIEPTPSRPGVLADHYLCVPIDSAIPVVLTYIYPEQRFTKGGDDTQRVHCWAKIPTPPTQA